MYFEGALADAPASARPDTSSAAQELRVFRWQQDIYTLQPPFGSRKLKRKQAFILYSTFPIDDSVRRLVVPAGENDPAFPEAQESIIKCAKDQQDDPSIKKMASGAKKPKIPGGYGYRSAIGLASSCHFFFRKKKFWNAAIASGDRIRSPKK